MRYAKRVVACAGVWFVTVGVLAGCPAADPIPVGEAETKDFSAFERFQFFGARPACEGRLESAEIKVDAGVYTLTSAVLVRKADAAPGLEACDDPASLEVGPERSRVLTADEVSLVKQAFSAVAVQEYAAPMFPFCGDVGFSGVAWDSFSYSVPANCASTQGLAPNAMERFEAIEDLVLGLR